MELSNKGFLRVARIMKENMKLKLVDVQRTRAIYTEEPQASLVFETPEMSVYYDSDKKRYLGTDNTYDRQLLQWELITDKA